MKRDPFSLSQLLSLFKNPKFNQYFWSPIERFSGLKKLSYLHNSLEKQHSEYDYVGSVISKLDISYLVQSETDIPETGPLLIVANHPFGALETLILIDYMKSSRIDLRVMANIFLKRIFPLSKLLFGVFPYQDTSAKKHNFKVMREIYKWLNNGNTLICFPAGDVSHIQFKPLSIRDGLWETQIAKLARTTNSSVLPVYIDGKNSLWFYLLTKRFHALRYARELLNKKGGNIKVRIGNLILPEEFKSYPSDIELIQFFRSKSDQLSD